MIINTTPNFRHSESRFYLGEESRIKSQNTGFFALLRMTVLSYFYKIFNLYEFL